jgi:hypothetical protein
MLDAVMKADRAQASSPGDDAEGDIDKPSPRASE